METEIIDKLFLELSQAIKAKTKRELELEKAICIYQREMGDITEHMNDNDAISDFIHKWNDNV